jgi:hypothetical protein
MRRLRWVGCFFAAAVCVGVVAAPASAGSAGSTHLLRAAAPSKTCPRGYVRAVVGGAIKCLHAGEFCASRYNTTYRRYGFVCLNGRLRRRTVTAAPQPPPPPPPTVGTRANPFPLGTAAQDARWSIRVNSVNWDAWPIVAAENMFNDPPRTGSQDVMVNITAQYLGSGTTAAWLDLGTSLDVVGQSGISYSQGPTYSCGVLPSSLNDVDTVFTGATFTVNVCWMVPIADVSTLELYFHDFDTNTEGFFALR